MASTTKWPDVGKLPIDEPPTEAPRNSSDIPDDDDMGFNDPDNILYVNMTGPDLGSRFKDRLDELAQMLQLTHQLATIHAGIQVKRRKAEGQLPTDGSNASGWIRAQYRARVLDHYFNNGTYAWMYSPQRNQVSRTIHVERTRFHWQLLANVLEGILLPRPLAAALEAIFKGISDTINETNYTANGRTFWSMLQVYTYDPVRDDLRASLRNISYSLSQEMYRVSKNKSTMTMINVNWNFDQVNFAFNETTWNRLRPTVESYIHATGIDNIQNPGDVPV